MNYNLDLANGTYLISGQSSGDGNLIKSCLSNPILYKSNKPITPTGYKVTISSSYTKAVDSCSVWMEFVDGSTQVITAKDNKGKSWEEVVKVSFGASGSGSGYVFYTMGGVSAEIGPYNDIILTGDMVVTSSDMWCLTGDTLVTMSDRTTKRLDEVKIGDYILSYDWATMNLVANKVIRADETAHGIHSEYDKWTFSDGTIVKTVLKHRFFNVERKAFVYMDEWNIGEHTINIKGEKVKLISHETIYEPVGYYRITGELGTNYFANGLLTGDRYCPTNIEF